MVRIGPAPTRPEPAAGTRHLRFARDEPARIVPRLPRLYREALAPAVAHSVGPERSHDVGGTGRWHQVRPETFEWFNRRAQRALDRDLRFDERDYVEISA
jgi:hypothetical protein